MHRVVIVTGGGRGIGREIALSVSRRGDFTAVIDKDYDTALETENLIGKANGKGIAYHADLTEPDEVVRVFKKIAADNGNIAGLVNNAGGHYQPKPIEELTVDFWNVVIDSNLKSAFLCSLEAFKYMKANGYGKIVNISSTLFVTSGVGLSPYIAAKGGVVGLTRAFAVDMGPFNISVNAIAPGLTVTDYAYKTLGEERFAFVKGLKAIKRDQRPDDLIGTILFLLDSGSDFLTGQTLVVDGGRAFL